MHDSDAFIAVRPSPSQLQALRHVRDRAIARQPAAREALLRVLERGGCPGELLDQALVAVAAHARIVLHFHPDRITRDGETVAQGLARTQLYRNQFETGISAGSRSAFGGGAREEWEARLLGGAYHSGTPAAERPKYGALELIRHPDGPLPRFGSCYFVLKPAVSARATFTFPGSEQAGATERLGTIDTFEPVLAPLIAEVASGRGGSVPWAPFVVPTLGVAGLTVSTLLDALIRGLPEPRLEPSLGEPGRVLDSAVEAQVHDDVRLRHDVECLVADPSFEETETGDRLADLSRTCGFPMRWHCGFELDVAHVPVDFRGPAMPRLARQIVTEGKLTAARIGAAEASLVRSLESWQEWGTVAQTLQHLKQLWHVLVFAGTPSRGGEGERRH